MNVSADDIVITNIENLANDLIAITFFVRGMFEDLISGQTVLEAVQVYLCNNAVIWLTFDCMNLTFCITGKGIHIFNDISFHCIGTESQVYCSWIYTS